MRHERFSIGSSCLRRQDWCFNLQKVAAVEVLPDEFDNLSVNTRRVSASVLSSGRKRGEKGRYLTPLLEYLKAVPVHKEVKMSVSESLFWIHQTGACWDRM